MLRVHSEAADDEDAGRRAMGVWYKSVDFCARKGAGRCKVSATSPRPLGAHAMKAEHRHATKFLLKCCELTRKRPMTKPSRCSTLISQNVSINWF